MLFLHRTHVIIQSVGRKGKKIKLVGKQKVSTNETAVDLLYNDYPNNESGFEKLRRELYSETYDVEKQDSFYNVTSREDNAKSKSDKVLKKIKEFSKKTDTQLFEIFKNDAETYFSRGELQDNIVRMISKMQRNEGGEYSHIDLTNAVIAHDNTKKFISQVKKFVIKKLIEKKEDINTLEIIDNGTGEIYLEMVDPKKKKEDQVDKPRFNNSLDKTSGIQIAINDVWAFQIYLTEYHEVNNVPHGELRFDFYDHFGLDYPDIEKYDNDIFISWFILQHFRGYQPFITKVSFNHKF